MTVSSGVGSSGMRMRITREQIAKLDAIGFEWRPVTGDKSENTCMSSACQCLSLGGSMPFSA